MAILFLWQNRPGPSPSLKPLWARCISQWTSRPLWQSVFPSQEAGISDSTDFHSMSESSLTWMFPAGSPAVAGFISLITSHDTFLSHNSIWDTFFEPALLPHRVAPLFYLSVNMLILKPFPDLFPMLLFLYRFWRTFNGLSETAKAFSVPF